MTHSKALFSVHFCQSSQELLLDDYRHLLDRVESGIQKLLKPLRLMSSVRFVRCLDSTGKEWMDVHLQEGSQLSFVRELEASIDSTLDLLDIEVGAAASVARQALHTLRELQFRKTWNSGDLLNLVDRRIKSSEAAALGRDLETEDHKVSIRFSQGHISNAPVPHRRFSALCLDSIELSFRPSHVGVDRAFVSLARTAMKQINAKARRIEVSWHEPVGHSISDRLFESTKAQTWITARCKVVVNSTGAAKALLLETLLE